MLKSLAWIPDRIMLPIQYYAVLKRIPNLKNPARFTEWIQWYKINVRDELMAKCTDKYRVREYISKILDCYTNNYLTELLDVTNDATKINFESLPKKFVIKTSDGGNGDNVLICRDKDKLDIEDAIVKVNSWRNKNTDVFGREWAYTGAKESLIVIEELLEDVQNDDGSIDDYKFLCFSGKFKCLWVDKSRYSDHHRGFWDENLNFLKGVVSDHPTFEMEPRLPENIDEMIKVAEKIAQPFIFARVDLYNIKGRIVFGEITFYPWSGYVQFVPDKFDFELGSFFDKNYKYKKDNTTNVNLSIDVGL